MSSEQRHEKSCLCNIRKTKAQISMRIRAVWSAPLFSLPRLYIISSCYICNFMTLSCFCSWAARFESYLVENPEDVFLWRSSKVKVINSAWVLVYMCTIWRICIWATTWQNQQNGMCAQWTRRSAWASTQSDQSSLSAWRNLWSLATHSADSENSDLSLRWAHSHFVGFVMRWLI